MFNNDLSKVINNFKNFDPPLVTSWHFVLVQDVFALYALLKLTHYHRTENTPELGIKTLGLYPLLFFLFSFYRVNSRSSLLQVSQKGSKSEKNYFHFLNTILHFLHLLSDK